jgi:subtilisin family serine protease
MSTIDRGADSGERASRSPEVHWNPVVEFKISDEHPVIGPPELFPLESLIPEGHPLHAIAEHLVPLSVYMTTTPQKINNIAEKARRVDPTYRAPRFENILRVQTGDVETAHQLATVLRESPDVDFAEVQRVVPLPGVVTPLDDPLNALQVQHRAPREGINAVAAWAMGANGLGVSIVDLEHGYNASDYLPPITLVHGDPSLVGNVAPEHGTAVLGVLAERDDTSAGVGIAPAANVGFAVRYWGDTSADFMADAIRAALTTLKYGDILLIDDQYAIDLTGDGSTFVVPIELHPVVQSNLGNILAQGVIFIEPAGNGSLNLDPLLPITDAITVGGINAGSMTRVDIEYMSNYGDRVVCHARYGGIVTPGWMGDQLAYGTFPGSGPMNSPTAYSNTFHGTSATAAIVAGAACLVQSFAIQKFGYRVSPKQMRDLLKTYGLASFAPLADRVGIMPDVELCIQALIRPVDAWIHAGLLTDNGKPPRPWGGCMDIQRHHDPLIEVPRPGGPPHVFARPDEPADMGHGAGPREYGVTRRGGDRRRLHRPTFPAALERGLGSTRKRVHWTGTGRRQAA